VSWEGIVRFAILCALLGGCVEYKFSPLDEPGAGLDGDITDDEGSDDGIVVRGGDDSEFPTDAVYPDDGTPDGDGDDGSSGGDGGTGGGDGSGGDTGVTGEEGGDSGTGGEIPDDACVLASEIDGYLDAFQTAGDGRVLYCHSGSGKSFVFVDSDIDSCLAHLDHRGDVFPTTLCDS
jgi:hypothetical protein